MAAGPAAGSPAVHSTQQLHRASGMHAATAHVCAGPSIYVGSGSAVRAHHQAQGYAPSQLHPAYTLPVHAACSPAAGANASACVVPAPRPSTTPAACSADSNAAANAHGSSAACSVTGGSVLSASSLSMHASSMALSSSRMCGLDGAELAVSEKQLMGTSPGQAHQVCSSACGVMGARADALAPCTDDRADRTPHVMPQVTGRLLSQLSITRGVSAAGPAAAAPLQPAAERPDACSSAADPAVDCGEYEDAASMHACEGEGEMPEDLGMVAAGPEAAALAGASNAPTCVAAATGVGPAVPVDGTQYACATGTQYACATGTLGCPCMQAVLLHTLLLATVMVVLAAYLAHGCN